MELRLDISDLRHGTAVLNEAIELFGSGEPLDVAGAIVESQTRRRIESEKESPEGIPWPEWSPAYAKTRHDNQSLLIGEGDLLDSIEHHTDGDESVIGSNLVYAAAQNAGLDMTIISTGARVKIPARTYLGLSRDNEAELEQALLDWAAGRLNA